MSASLCENIQLHFSRTQKSTKKQQLAETVWINVILEVMGKILLNVQDKHFVGSEIDMVTE